MHLLALLETTDAPRLKDMLSKRSDTLRQLLWQQADSVVIQIEGDPSSGAEVSSSNAASNLATHAGSPFSVATAASGTNQPSARHPQHSSDMDSIPLSAVGKVGAQVPGPGMAEVVCALRSMHVRLPSDPFCLRAAGMLSSPSQSMGSSPPYSPSLLSKLMSLGEDTNFDSASQGSALPLYPTATATLPFGSFSEAQAGAIPASAQADTRAQVCVGGDSMAVLSGVEAAVARGLARGGSCQTSPSLAAESCGVAAALAGLARVLEPLKEKHAALLGDVEVLAGHLQFLRQLAGCQ